MIHGRPPVRRTLKSPLDVDEASLGSILDDTVEGVLFDPLRVPDWPVTHLYFYNP